jgi:hypothetical protein
MIATRAPANPICIVPHVEQGHRRHTPPPAINDLPPRPSLLWMTTSKDYRSDADDGVLTALLLGPITVAGMLYGTLISEYSSNSLYPQGWLIEAPKYLHKSMGPIHPREALLNSRRNLVQLSTLCAFVLLTHICTSRLSKPNKAASTESERKTRKGMRSWNLVCYVALISTMAVAFHVACDVMGLEIWKGWSKFQRKCFRSHLSTPRSLLLRRGGNFLRLPVLRLCHDSSITWRFHPRRSGPGFLGMHGLIHGNRQYDNC